MPDLHESWAVQFRDSTIPDNDWKLHPRRFDSREEAEANIVVALANAGIPRDEIEFRVGIVVEVES